MFKTAVKQKLRFDSPKGKLTTEDLYDLPLLATNGGVCLDDIAKALSKKLKESSEESFVLKKTTTNTTLELKLEIVKHVIADKLAEQEARTAAADRKAKKEKLLAIISEKEDANLKRTSISKLREMVDEL